MFLLYGPNWSLSLILLYTSRYSLLLSPYYLLYVFSYILWLDIYIILYVFLYIVIYAIDGTPAHCLTS